MPNQQACRCEPIIQRLPRRGPLKMGTSAFLGRSRKGERITVPQKLLVRNSASSIFYTRHSSRMAIDTLRGDVPKSQRTVYSRRRLAMEPKLSSRVRCPRGHEIKTKHQHAETAGEQAG